MVDVKYKSLVCVPQRALAGNIKDKTLVHVNFDLVDVVKKSRFSVAVLAEGSAWYRLSFTTNDATSPNLKVIGARIRATEFFTSLFFEAERRRRLFTPIVDICTGATKIVKRDESFILFMLDLFYFLRPSFVIIPRVEFDVYLLTGISLTPISRLYF